MPMPGIQLWLTVQHGPLSLKAGLQQELALKQSKMVLQLLPGQHRVTPRPLVVGLRSLQTTSGVPDLVRHSASLVQFVVLLSRQ